ncbi:MAG: discoidin domain-containing protein, partial [Microgenomates group bacterium]
MEENNQKFLKKVLFGLFSLIILSAVALLLPYYLILNNQSLETRTKAAGNIESYLPPPPQKIPVLVLKFFPLDSTGTRLDYKETNLYVTLEEIREKIRRLNAQLIESLNKGSIYHGYKNPNGQPILNYEIIEEKEFLTFVPAENEAYKIVDRNIETGKWGPSPPFIGDYFIIDAGEEQTFNRIFLYFYDDNGPKEFHIDVSSTGRFQGEEIRVVNEKNALVNAPPYTSHFALEYFFPYVSGRYIKFTIDKYRDDNPEGYTKQTNLYEINLFLDDNYIDLSQAIIYSQEGFKKPTTPDHYKIFTKLLNPPEGFCNYIESKGIKEIWIWMYHNDWVGPIEFSVVGKDKEGRVHKISYFDINFPICNKSYAVFDYNYQGGLGDLLEDHAHRIEETLNYFDGRHLTPPDQWQNLLFWGNFVGSDISHKIIKPGCGWTHRPPNGESDYDWRNEREVLSDCENWRPDGKGEKKLVSCHTWYGPVCEDDGGTKFKIWWMQNIPSVWWVYIGNFDLAINESRDENGNLKLVNPLPYLPTPTPTLTPTPTPSYLTLEFTNGTVEREVQTYYQNSWYFGGNQY